jgi:DNA-binding CsgD family transcriptional regulator
MVMSQRGPDEVTIDRSAMKLTDTILGYDERDLNETLQAIASEIGIRHIAYLQFASDNNYEASLPTAIATYSRAWQTRYFLCGYVHIDPVVAHGQKAVLPFDWEALTSDDPDVLAFFADATKHRVGLNGISVPVRNGMGARSLVSFTSDHPKPEWNGYKRQNMASLMKLSFLIDSAAQKNSGLALSSIRLSRREEECLIWAARGRSDKEIADVLNIGFSSVKVHLDVARHKLHCMNLGHAIAVAIATGVIPATALQ